MKPDHLVATTASDGCAVLIRLPWRSRPWVVPFLTTPGPSSAVSAKPGSRILDNTSSFFRTSQKQPAHLEGIESSTLSSEAWW
jgi:hypothetical protein